MKKFEFQNAVGDRVVVKKSNLNGVLLYSVDGLSQVETVVALKPRDARRVAKALEKAAQ